MNQNKQNSTNTMAILGLIFAFLFSTVGLILSIVALNQIKKSREEGKGLAIAGLIISIIKLVIGAVLIAISMIAAIYANTVWDDLKDDMINNTKCLYAKKCEYDAISGKYYCIYENEDGIEEYITCESN